MGKEVVPQAEYGEQIDAALYEFLRPIVELFLTYRMTYPGFDSVVKRIFVEQALRREETENPGKPPRVSTIVWYTGISAYLVKQMMESLEGEEHSNSDKKPVNISPESKLIEAWKSKMFEDAKTGEPAKLRIRGSDGLTFQKLARHALGSSVSYDDMLKSLRKAKCVEIHLDDNDERRAVLVKRFFVAAGNDRSNGLRVAARAARHFFQPFLHNLTKQEGDEDWVQYEVWTNRLPKEKLEQFRSEVNEFMRGRYQELMTQLEDIEHDWELGPETADSIHAGGGFYYFEDRSWKDFQDRN